MRLGVDFDNTLVCYDGVFHRAAVERGLIPASESHLTKERLRDRMRAENREDDWTRLQGYVYGPAMAQAKPFPGALEFLDSCRRKGVSVCVISHRTAQPFLGPAYDLLSSAREWLERNGFFEKAGLPREHAHFELTKQAKLARIRTERCTHFIDDLPEFLGERDFPVGVERLLFDPNGGHANDPRWGRAASWLDVAARLQTAASANSEED